VDQRQVDRAVAVEVRGDPLRAVQLGELDPHGFLSEDDGVFELPAGVRVGGPQGVCGQGVGREWFAVFAEVADPRRGCP